MTKNTENAMKIQRVFWQRPKLPGWSKKYSAINCVWNKSSLYNQKLFPKSNKK